MSEVVHLCRTAPPVVGGMEEVLRGIVSRQRDAGWSVSVVTGPGPTAGSLPGTVRLPAIGGPSWRWLVGLRDALRGARVVIVHGVDPLLPQVLALRPRSARVVVVTHGGIFHGGRGPERLAAARWGIAPFLRRCDAVWCSSASDQALFAACGVRGDLVPNGVAMSEAPRAPVPGRWVVPGRVDHHKGHRQLLRALAPWAGGAFQLRMVGPCRDAALLRSLRAEARGLGLGDQVVWRGGVGREEWWEELATAELALFPSTWEGFGVAVVEAMSAGACPVVEAIPAHAALVEDGVTGHVLRFAEGVWPERWRPALGAAAREAAATWSWASVGPTWDEALAAVLR